MYSLNTSALWEYWLELLGVLLMLRTFYEPALSLSGLPWLTCSAEPQSVWLHAAEGIAMLCFCIDIYAKLTYMGYANYCNKSWHLQYLFCVCCLTADAVLGGICGQRPFRFLRPLLIFYRNREQRRILMSLIHLVSHQLGVALLSTIGMVAFFGALGVHLYGSSFDRGLELHFGTDNGDENHLKGTFNSFLHASLEIWVLISSAENFLDLLLPALRTEEGGHVFTPLLFYFGPVLYLGYFFLMSVLLAVVVDEYLLAARHLVQQEHHRERKGLLRAFALLNPSKSGHVHVQIWTRLLQDLFPKISKQEAILRFHMVAYQAPEKGVHVREFLRLHSNLSVDLVEDIHAFRKPILVALPDRFRLFLLILNALLFISFSPLQSLALQRLLFAAHTAIVPVLALDRKSWAPSRAATHAGCLGTAAVCAGVYWSYDVALGVPPPAYSQIVGQVSLFVLLVQGSRVLRLIWRLLSYVLPQFLQVSVSLAMLVYIFGLVGMQLFAGVSLFSEDERFAHENLAGCGAPFSSLPCTLFILFQVMTNEDWHVIMRAMWYTSGSLGLAFILAFFLVINVCLLSLTTALTINAFLAAKTDLLDQGLLVDNSHLDEQVNHHGGISPLPSRRGNSRTSERRSVDADRTSKRGGVTRSMTCGNLCQASEAASAVSVDPDDDHKEDHQDFHLADTAESSLQIALQHAEMAMMEHELASFRGGASPALGRPIKPVGRAADQRQPRFGSQATQKGAGKPGQGCTRRIASERTLGSGAKLTAVAKAAASGAKARSADGGGVNGSRGHGPQTVVPKASGKLGAGGHADDERACLLGEGEVRSDAPPHAKSKTGISNQRRKPIPGSGTRSVSPAAGMPPQPKAQDPSPPSLHLVGFGASLEALPAEAAAITRCDAEWEARVEAREGGLARTSSMWSQSPAGMEQAVALGAATKLLSPKSSPGREVSFRSRGALASLGSSPTQTPLTQTDFSADEAWERREKAVALEHVVQPLGGLDEVLVAQQRELAESQRRRKIKAAAAAAAANEKKATTPTSLAEGLAPPQGGLATDSPSKCATAPAVQELAPSLPTDSLACEDRQAMGTQAQLALAASDDAVASLGSRDGAVTRGRIGARKSKDVTPRLTGVTSHKSSAPAVATLPVEEAASPSAQTRKWRVASRTVTMFSRRAAAGMSPDDEPLNEEEEAAIAELTSGGD